MCEHAYLCPRGVLAWQTITFLPRTVTWYSRSLPTLPRPPPNESVPMQAQIVLITMFEGMLIAPSVATL